MTLLFDYLELRGTDAAGAWGVESAGKNRIVYHKEPIRSSSFVQRDIWKQTDALKPDLLLLHARAASSGDARFNANNHPFVSSDRKIAMIHNGRINEADSLSQKYQTISDTDSEVLLRMYENGLRREFVPIDDVPDDISQRITGIQDIWSNVCEGAMAVAIGERGDDLTRYLFLFHNVQRPLWTIDLRERFGQIVFFSSPDIWYQSTARASSSLDHALVGHEKLIEIPTNQIWAYKIDAENRVPGDEQIYKFEVELEAATTEWVPGDRVPVAEDKPDVPVITGLDDQDAIKPLQKPTSYCSKGIFVCKELLDTITALHWHLCSELDNKTIDEHEYREIVEQLGEIHREIKLKLEELRLGVK